MTEAEWLNCPDPEAMLDLFQIKASERKLRLLACACCRQFWHRLEDGRARSAVEAAERFADGVAPSSALWAAFDECWDAERRVLHFHDDFQRAAAGTAYWKTGFASPGVI